jgi:glutamate-1-semialdehyde 2,1-aminomutase
MTMSKSENNLATIERARRFTAAEKYDIESRYPGVFASAEGSWMRDVEGNRVLDVTAASGSLLLGNTHPKIAAAVAECATHCGATFASTLTPKRIELAERLCERYPAGEKAVFFRTGSDATTAAIRLARAYSGRDIVVTAGYHGWHDWQLKYLTMGFDAATRTVNFGYNETVLRRLLEAHARDIACVIVTPEPAWFDVDYFRRLSELCRRHDVLFILDEVITGLRWGERGLNGTGGVRADVITLSKGLGNGIALAPVLGRREVIDAYDKAQLAGTYTREVTPMAAALAVLDIIADGSIHRHCEAMGLELKKGMTDILRTLGIPAYLSGPGMMFDVVTASEQLSCEIYRAAYDYGAYFEDSGTHMVTAAFGEAEVRHALNAFEQGARRVAASRGDVATGGELPLERRQQFGQDAFCGFIQDTETVLGKCDEIIEAIAKRDRSLAGTGFSPACT